NRLGPAPGDAGDAAASGDSVMSSVDPKVFRDTLAMTGNFNQALIRGQQAKENAIRDERQNKQFERQEQWHNETSSRLKQSFDAAERERDLRRREREAAAAARAKQQAASGEASRLSKAAAALKTRFGELQVKLKAIDASIKAGSGRLWNSPEVEGLQ